MRSPAGFPDTNSGWNRCSSALLDGGTLADVISQPVAEGFLFLKGGESDRLALEKQAFGSPTRTAHQAYPTDSSNQANQTHPAREADRANRQGVLLARQLNRDALWTN